MRAEIIKKLKELEVEHNIEIVYACESGSRAWGFPSNDSDYDVRFFYKHKLDWYLSIEDKKDTITDVGPVLDFAGWELRKTMRLFRASNSSLYEKLRSPITYINTSELKNELLRLENEYYRPLSGVHHYLSLSKNFMRDYMNGEKVKLKKYFYVLRSTLAAIWIVEKEGVPPMEFNYLRELILDKEVVKWIDLMLRLKMKNDETYEVNLFPPIDNWLTEAIRNIENKLTRIDREPKSETERLNKLFRKWILED